MGKGVDASKEFNMNLGWVMFLNNIIQTYGEAYLTDNYKTMYKCLSLLESTISPKVDNDLTELNLKKIKNNIGQMIIKDSEGKIVKYFPQLINETEELIDATYALILQKMDAAGILTWKPKDPKLVFGNFGGS